MESNSYYCKRELFYKHFSIIGSTKRVEKRVIVKALLKEIKKPKIELDSRNIESGIVILLLNIA